MKILIISVNALGDTYISCSAINFLKNHFQKLEIHFLANKNSKFFLEKFKLNKIFYLRNKTVRDIIKTLLLIKKEKYDIVYSFFPGRINSFFLIVSNSKVKSGFVNFRKLNEWYDSSQRLFIRGKSTESKIQYWKPSMNFLERVEMCLLSTDVIVNNLLKPKFNFKELIFEKNFSDVVIHFKSRRSNKSIKNQELINLIYDLINKKKLKVTLIGIKENFVDIEKICNNKNMKLVINPTIEKLISTLFETKIFIGVDSFPIHLADAYNIKTIGIFGNTYPNSVFQSMNNKFIIRKKKANDVSCKDILEIFEFVFFHK